MKSTDLNVSNRFFDTASTTCCSFEAENAMAPYFRREYGNPSSSHAMGRQAAQIIRVARRFFSEVFETTPEQVIFTGSGTEANNLALSGIALGHAFRLKDARRTILYSAIEHGAVKNTAMSLTDFGFNPISIPVTKEGQIDEAALMNLLSPDVLMISIMRLNNIVGSILPVEELAQKIKSRFPKIIFHTDAVQAFTKVPCPKAGSAVDLISISGHKIEGPKGVGALIVLNRDLLNSNHLRPLIWGGGQEEGFRSGTESPALICGFYEAAKNALAKHPEFVEKTRYLSTSFFDRLIQSRLIDPSNTQGSFLVWNSPIQAAPHIVNLSAPGISAAILAKFLEKKNCLVATGSACSSSSAGKPDPTLTAMGLSPEIASSSVRISFSSHTTLDDIDHLVESLKSAHQFFTSLAKEGSLQV